MLQGTTFSSVTLRGTRCRVLALPQEWILSTPPLLTASDKPLFSKILCNHIRQRIGFMVFRKQSYPACAC